MNNYRFLADNQVCIWTPPSPPPLPSLPPWFSAVLVLILVIFRGICSLVFSKGPRLKKNEAKISGFSAVFDSPPDFGLFWFLFWWYFATFFTQFSYGSILQNNWSKNEWIFGSFGSHFGIFPGDYCVIFAFSLEYCKISGNTSKIN